MKQRPSLQWYPQDFLSSFDVQTMNAEEIGCYCLLLFNMWVNGGELPDNIDDISRLCRGIKPTEKVLKKFYKKKNFIYNSRIDIEIEKQNKFSKSMSKAAKKRWDKPKTKAMPRQCLGNAKAMPKVCSSSSSSSSSSNNNSSSKNLTKKKLIKWFNEMEDVSNPKGLANKYLSLYSTEIIKKALNDQNCINRNKFVELCEFFKK